MPRYVPHSDPEDFRASRRQADMTAAVQPSAAPSSTLCRRCKRREAATYLCPVCMAQLAEAAEQERRIRAEERATYKDPESNKGRVALASKNLDRLASQWLSGKGQQRRAISAALSREQPITRGRR